MSTCVHGHGDCPLLEEKNLRIAGLIESVMGLSDRLEASAASAEVAAATIRSLRAEISRLRLFGPNRLGDQ